MNAMQTAPFGFPKVMISTLAFDPRDFCTASDIIVVPSVADLAGLNDMLRRVLDNCAAAVAGHGPGDGRAASGPHWLLGDRRHGARHHGARRRRAAARARRARPRGDELPRQRLRRSRLRAVGREGCLPRRRRPDHARDQLDPLRRLGARRRGPDAGGGPLRRAAGGRARRHRRAQPRADPHADAGRARTGALRARGHVHPSACRPGPNCAGPPPPWPNG